MAKSSLSAVYIAEGGLDSTFNVVNVGNQMVIDTIETDLFKTVRWQVYLKTIQKTGSFDVSVVRLGTSNFEFTSFGHIGHDINHEIDFVLADNQTKIALRFKNLEAHNCEIRTRRYSV